MANLAANETRAVIEELQEMAFDPTMDQCCRFVAHTTLNPAHTHTERIQHGNTSPGPSMANSKAGCC